MYRTGRSRWRWRSLLSFLLSSLLQISAYRVDALLYRPHGKRCDAGPQARQTRLGALFLPLSPSPPPRAPLVMAQASSPLAVQSRWTRSGTGSPLFLILHIFRRRQQPTLPYLRHTASVRYPSAGASFVEPVRPSFLSPVAGIAVIIPSLPLSRGLAAAERWVLPVHPRLPAEK